MLKSIIYSTCIVCVQWLSCYVPSENGLFDRLVTQQRDSIIVGKTDFTERVINRSDNRLVVVKIYADNVAPLRQAYHKLAHEYRSKVACLEMDLFGAHNENYDIVMEHLKNHGVSTVSFPVFFIFRQRQLCDVIAVKEQHIQHLQSAIGKYCA